MTLETVYYVSQTVAVFIIVATLVAVLIQLRQTHRLAKLESSRTIWMDAGARPFWRSCVDPAPRKPVLLTRGDRGNASLGSDTP